MRYNIIPSWCAVFFLPTSTQSFAQFLRTDALDWQAMCIIPNKICWVLYLDVLILRAEGNLLDAVRPLKKDL